MTEFGSLTVDAVDLVTLVFASLSLVISSFLAVWSIGRQKRFHTFDVISSAHARLHRVLRDVEGMKRAGRFDVAEVMDIVKTADEVFATVDPYLRLTRRRDFVAADQAMRPGVNFKDALDDGLLERWLWIGRDAIRRYLRIA